MLEAFKQDSEELIGPKGEIHYLDYAATTFMNQSALEKYNWFQENIGVLWGKGHNKLADASYSVFAESIKKIKEFFGINDEYSLIFGKNATEITNILAFSVADFIKSGDVILVGPYEHHSNYLPWKYLARRKDAIFLEMPIVNDVIDIDYLKTIKDRIKICSYSSVANTNGFKVSISSLNDILPARSFVFVDESQKVAHEPIELSNRITGHILSSHKMYGPKNIAGAAVKNVFLNCAKPLLLGGGMISVQKLNDQWKECEKKFYAGTFDVGLVASWAEACDYLSRVTWNRIMIQQRICREFIYSELKNKKNISIISKADSSESLISFVHKNIHSHDVEEEFFERDVIIRSGHMCAQNALKSFGEYAICRISFGLGISDEDLLAAKEVIDKL